MRLELGERVFAGERGCHLSWLDRPEMQTTGDTTRPSVFGRPDGDLAG